MKEILLLNLKWLKQRSIQTLLILTLYVCVANFLPPTFHQFLYTVSIFIKDLLIWMMPLTVGFFIANAVISFERRAPFFILLLVLFETVSNLSSVWYAYGAAHIVADQLATAKAVALDHNFNALWRLGLEKPEWWSAEKGSIVGLLLGCLTAFNSKTSLKGIILRGKTIVEWILTRIFARLIPLFVLGFAAQMHQTHMLTHVLTHYSLLILWLTSFLFIYISFLFLLGAGFSLPRFIENIKNLLPATGIALMSGCSLSTMPWTISGTSKNLRTPSLAQAIIPATTNIQQIGDCIAQSFLCCLIYTYFYGHVPDMATWFSFSIVFVLARFATAAVLGGAIFVMLPIYEGYLHFTPEMIAIILTLNVILDPLITSTNVIANGALCRIFERVWEFAQALLSSPVLTAKK